MEIDRVSSYIPARRHSSQDSTVYSCSCEKPVLNDRRIFSWEKKQFVLLFTWTSGFPSLVSTARVLGSFHAPSAGDVTLSLSLSLCEASEGDATSRGRASTRTQPYMNRDTLTC
jgi:hypothetical protein